MDHSPPCKIHNCETPGKHRKLARYLGFEDDFFRIQDRWYDPRKKALVNWASLKLKALHCKDAVKRMISHSLGGYICKIHI